MFSKIVTKTVYIRKYIKLSHYKINPQKKKKKKIKNYPTIKKNRKKKKKNKFRYELQIHFVPFSSNFGPTL